MKKIQKSERRTFSIYHLDGSLDSVLETITEWRDQYGPTASFSVELAYGEYDTSDIVISWEREETDEELAARESAERLAVQWNKRAQKQKEDEELAIYKKVKERLEKQGNVV